MPKGKAKKANKPVELCFHRNIKIKVTAEHIKKGKPGDDNNCAIALALKEAFPDRADQVSVDSGTINVGDGITMETTTKMERFIELFDGTEDDHGNRIKGKVKPFSFTMPLSFAPVEDC
jgi:hypothetical protein